MYCAHCGTFLNDDTKFCCGCGRRLQTTSEETSNFAPLTNDFNTFTQPTDETKKKALTSSILTYGILSIALSYTGVFGILGIIFAIIAKSQIKKYRELFGELEATAAVGNGLSTAGIIIAISTIVFLLAYFAFFFLYIIFAILMTTILPATL